MDSYPSTDFSSSPLSSYFPGKLTKHHSVDWKMPFSPPKQGPRNLIQSLFSFDDSVILAAVICLLLVIFFVLLLHLYAKWFLSQSRRRSRTPVSVSQVLGPTRLRRFDLFPFDTDYPTKGLDSLVIASIPMFVYESDKKKPDLECVICLSVFEGGEVGRKLPKCCHGFHVKCIDMWLSSHSTCPICRTPAVMAVVNEVGEIDSGSDSLNEEGALEIVVEVPNTDRGSEVGGRSDGVSSTAPSLSSQAAAISESLKRMLSRSRSERKIRPLSNVLNDSDD